MSVIVTLRVSGDPAKLEQLASENEGMIAGIAERAKAQGLIAHRFYGSENEIMVVDEWPDAASFKRFFESEQDQIGPLMEQVGTSEPTITFWRKLDTKDDVGWE